MKKIQHSILTFFGFFTLAIGVLNYESKAISVETPISIRRVTVAEATGKAGRIPTLSLIPGYGLNISFINTQEIIEKVWLDNPQFVTLDVDGCLAGISKQTCSQPGATVIHLRRIEELDIAGLPQTNSTLLTVITSSKKERRIYTFRLIKSSEIPKYHTVEIVASSEEVVPPRRLSLNSVVLSQVNWQTIENGVRAAVARRLLRPNSPLWYRIENFLQLLKSGSSTIEAASNAGISLELVRKLQELGVKEQTINSSFLQRSTIRLYEKSVRFV